MPRQLHLAKSLEELNKCVIVDIKKEMPITLLSQTAKKLIEAAKEKDRVRDEEGAYVMFMRYFKIIETIQKKKEFSSLKNKELVTGLDLKNVPKAIERAEQLSSSLKKRYTELEEKSKEPETERIKELKEAQLNAKLDALGEGSKTRKDRKKDVVLNSFVEPKALKNLMDKKTETILYLDIRPQQEFTQSRIKIPDVLSIPEDELYRGITANRIEKLLDYEDRMIWLKRKDADNIVIVDWSTDKAPLPQPIMHLSEAMTKWDPGKEYKTVPQILQGGYELWLLTYPMLTTNPHVRAPLKTPTINHSMDKADILNFDYPDLDTAFIKTPDISQEKSNMKLDEPLIPNKPIVNKLNEPILSNNPVITKQPTVDRNLKPTIVSPPLDTKNGYQGMKNGYHDTKNGYQDTKNGYQDTTNGYQDIKNGYHDTKNGYQDTINGYQDDLDLSKIVNENQNNILGYPVTNGEGKTIEPYVPNVPKVPSRTLKPKDTAKDLKELERVKEILSNWLDIEQNALETLDDLDLLKNKKSSEQIDEIQFQKELEDLMENLSKWNIKSTEMQIRYKHTKKENEDLNRMIEESRTMSPSKQFKINEDDLKKLQDSAAFNMKLEERVFCTMGKKKDIESNVKRDIENMQQPEESNKQAALKNLEEIRKKKEQAEKAIAAARRTERGSPSPIKKVNNSARIDQNKNRGEGPARYTTQLRDSPKSSPQRGNLNRSHSAFDLSQVGQADNDDSNKNVPNVNRANKPCKRNIKFARQRNFDPMFATNVKWTGLKNLGNTCYMNSIIQCLNNTPALARYFHNKEHHFQINQNSRYFGEMAEEFGAVIETLQNRKCRTISLWDLKETIGRLHFPFKGTDQHDSHEFLIKLMDWLHEDLNLVMKKPPPMEEQNFDNISDHAAASKIMDEIAMRDDSIVTNLFNGLHRSVIRCSTCGNRSLTFEPFSILTLSFPPSGRPTIRNMLDHFYKETTIEYKCAKCNKLRSCTRKLDIWKLPPYLIIHLNRFEQHDVLTQKIPHVVDFPLMNLSLSNYICSQDNQHSNFNLYATSNHDGSMDGGHYVAYCKNYNEWMELNDNELYGNSSISKIKTTAYILFYQNTSK